MKIVALGVGLLAFFSVSLGDLWRESNSHAAASRGANAYQQKEYEAAARAYASAQQLAPSPRGAFNLGTAEVAAGQREQGAVRLGEAMHDPALRANALFNRGNGALAAKALDHAVRDYTEALRVNPNHAGAKRNLEIALNRKQSQQQGAGGKQDQQGQQQQQPKQQQPSPNGQQRPQPGQPDLDALLRSVQQQEQEELRRMKGRAAEGRVGW
jgi:tetratricopeptide (TPR) repeat protein